MVAKVLMVARPALLPLIYFRIPSDSMDVKKANITLHLNNLNDFQALTALLRQQLIFRIFHRPFWSSGTGRGEDRLPLSYHDWLTTLFWSNSKGGRTKQWLNREQNLESSILKHLIALASIGSSYNFTFQRTLTELWDWTWMNCPFGGWWCCQ